MLWYWAIMNLASESNELVSAGWRDYIHSRWNKLDLLTCVVQLLAASFRLHCQDVDVSYAADAAAGYNLTQGNLTQGGDEVGLVLRCAALQQISRNLYGLSILLSFLKVLQYLTFNENVGVLVIIIGQVVANDVWFFGQIIFVLALGTGLCFRVMAPMVNAQVVDALADPDPAVLSARDFLQGSVYFPFWKTVGVDGVSFGEIGSVVDGQPTSWLMPAILFLYFATAIVLVNLLIASMTSTYQRVKDSSSLYWLFERAKIILEFKYKSPFPPPFTLIPLLFTVPRDLIRFLSGRSRHAKNEPGFRMTVPPKEQLRLRMLEQNAQRHYLKSQEEGEREEAGWRLSSLGKAIEELRGLQESQFENLNAVVREVLEAVFERGGGGQRGSVVEVPHELAPLAEDGDGVRTTTPEQQQHWRLRGGTSSKRLGSVLARRDQSTRAGSMLIGGVGGAPSRDLPPPPPGLGPMEA